MFKRSMKHKRERARRPLCLSPAPLASQMNENTAVTTRVGFAPPPFAVQGYRRAALLTEPFGLILACRRRSILSDHQERCMADHQDVSERVQDTGPDRAPAARVEPRSDVPRK